MSGSHRRSARNTIATTTSRTSIAGYARSVIWVWSGSSAVDTWGRSSWLAIALTAQAGITASSQVVAGMCGRSAFRSATIAAKRRR